MNKEHHERDEREGGCPERVGNDLSSEASLIVYARESEKAGLLGNTVAETKGFSETRVST
jgi:hypothetical protein